MLLTPSQGYSGVGVDRRDIAGG
jgi:hypothetical protein